MSLHVYWNGSRGSSQPVPLLAPGFRPGRSNAPVSGTTARCTEVGETFVSIMSSHAYIRRCVACDTVPQARSGRPCREAAPARPAALEEVGEPCWIAPRNMTPGADYPNEIVRAIRECRGQVVLITPSANESQDVLQEVQRVQDERKRSSR